MAAVLALTLHGVSPELLPPGLRDVPSVLRYTLARETLNRILDKVRPQTCRTAAGPNQSEAGDSVALTFDDGYRSDFEVVFPALVSRGLPATFLVTVDNVGREGYVTWDQLRDMSAAGMEIGSHGLTHRNLLTLRPEQVRQEIRHSKTALEERLGTNVATFAPVGGHHARRMVDEVWSAGYRVFASMVPGRTPLRSGVLFLRRNYVLAHHGATYLDRLLRGDVPTLLGNRARHEVLGAAQRLLGWRSYERLRVLLLRKERR